MYHIRFLLFALGALYSIPKATSAESLPVDGWLTGIADVQLRRSEPVMVLSIEGVVPTGVAEPGSAVDMQIDGGRTERIQQGIGAFCAQRIIVGDPAVHLIRLTGVAPGHLPPPDGRPTAARITRLTFRPLTMPPSEWTADSDICTSVIGLGSGWYPVETWQNQHFRWMSARGELGIAPEGATAGGVLTLTAEPGEVSAGGDNYIKLLTVDGRLLDKSFFKGRQTIDLVMPAVTLAQQPLRLEFPGSAPAAKDPRQLNLRVFALSFQSGPRPGDGKK